MKELIEIFKTENEELEILYFDHQIIFIHGDIINYFNSHELVDTIVFVKLMAKCGITELQRAQITAKIMNCVDQEIENEKSEYEYYE